jgi:hypothetical protein
MKFEIGEVRTLTDIDFLIKLVLCLSVKSYIPFNAWTRFNNLITKQKRFRNRKIKRTSTEVFDKLKELLALNKK